jgi:hypothetical protein
MGFAETAATPTVFRCFPPPDVSYIYEGSSRGMFLGRLVDLIQKDNPPRVVDGRGKTGRQNHLKGAWHGKRQASESSL